MSELNKTEQNKNGVAMTASSVNRCPVQLINCIQCKKPLEYILTSWTLLMFTDSYVVNNIVIEKEEK